MRIAHDADGISLYIVVVIRPFIAVTWNSRLFLYLFEMSPRLPLNTNIAVYQLFGQSVGLENPRLSNILARHHLCHTFIAAARREQQFKTSTQKKAVIRKFSDNRLFGYRMYEITRNIYFPHTLIKSLQPRQYQTFRC